MTQRFFAMCNQQTGRLISDKLVKKFSKVAEACGERTLNDVFIARFVSSIRNSFRHYCTKNPQADLNDIALQAESLLSIQKDLANAPNNNQDNYNAGKLFNWNPEIATIRRT